MRTVDTVLFDKTGTLTRGQPAVTARRPAEHDPGRDERARAGRRRRGRLASTRSPGPSSRRRHGTGRSRVPAAARLHARHRAVGVCATVDGRTVAVGGPAPARARPAAATLAGRRGLAPATGAIILHVLVDGEVVGALALADEIRPESRAAVDALHDRGVRGRDDHRRRRGRWPTRSAAELGIDRVFAGVRPEDKSAKVAELQAEGTTSRHGRRRRQRRPRPGPGRRRHRHRRRHRRRDRLGRRHPRLRRPPLGALGDRAVPRRPTAR